MDSLLLQRVIETVDIRTSIPCQGMERREQHPVRRIGKKRLARDTENVDRDWSNVLFSDEASFWAWVPIKRAWSAAGERFLQRTVKDPIKIHV